MQLTLHAFDLRLRHTFAISRESIDIQPTLIVELEHEGRRGFGEATSNAYYGFTVRAMAERLIGLKPLIEGSSWSEPSELWSQLALHLQADPFSLCALDQAAHDLWGKLRGEPVWKLWGLKLENLPASDYTIGIDRTEVMVSKMQEFPGWPIYKIKLGTERDLEIVRELRRHTTAVFRVDANCGWTADQAIALSAPLKELGVEFIEQPLPADRWEDLTRVGRESALPIMADESCITEGDVERCAGVFQGVNIKLVKCGGLTPARRMIAQARRLGLKTMVGCMTESSVGISAIAQLLPLLDFVDMDGAVLLAEDIASGVKLDHGRCIFPDLPGHGVHLLAPGATP